VREAVPAIWAMRSGSDGGDQAGEGRTAAGGAAPLRGGEVAGVGAGAWPPGLGRDGENAMANPMAGKRPRVRGKRGEERWGESLGLNGGALARHSGHGEAA
jgi:hypothetical protein